jgi:hypothetical protein
VVHAEQLADAHRRLGVDAPRAPMLWLVEHFWMRIALEHAHGRGCGDVETISSAMPC